MDSSPAAVPSPVAEARPVDGAERLILLDALRGFALCGVFVSNVYMWFSGRAFLTREQVEAMVSSASLFDVVTMRVVMFLVFGKFITIFSFLFGLGFAVQMGRAEQRGASVAPLYARRLGAMLAIGLTHLFLLWYGDILTTYAVLGFGLLLFRKRTDKTILIWASVLILLVPLVGALFTQLPQLLGSAEASATAAKEARAHAEAIHTRTLEAFTHGSYFDVVRANAAFYFAAFFKPVLTVALSLLGRFLLGLIAGRSRLFHDVAQHRALFRKLLIWGLVAGVIGNGAGVVLSQLFLKKVLNPDNLPWLPLVMSVVRQFGEVGLAAVYVTGISLLFQRPAWQRVLAVLSPVGRMALTNYLSQTVLSLLFFYGYGLGFITKLGPATLVAVPVGIFILQIGFSHLWLSRFRFGPAEWVWRSLTYGKAQPMRRAPISPTGAEAAA